MMASERAGGEEGGRRYRGKLQGLLHSLDEDHLKVLVHSVLVDPVRTEPGNSVSTLFKDVEGGEQGKERRSFASLARCRSLVWQTHTLKFPHLLPTLSSATACKPLWGLSWATPCRTGLP